MRRVEVINGIGQEGASRYPAMMLALAAEAKRAAAKLADNIHVVQRASGLKAQATHAHGG